MLSTTSLPTSAVDELRHRLRGGVHLPGDADYTDTCTLFNAAIQRRPALVAQCAAPDDVIAALAFAETHGLPLAVRAGGHAVTGQSLCDDGLVLDLRPMCDVIVDPVRQIARVGGGATWAQVDEATGAHGLATTGGRVSTTGVAGLTMGGGSGWLERKHGLACDNLIAAELVMADGRLVRTSADEHPELLWALRGAGGNFGVVTAMEFALHPLESEVLAGLVLHPAEAGLELMQCFRDVMIDAPRGLSLAFAYLTGPDEDDVPEELRGQPACAVIGMYAGPVDKGEAALAELRAFGEPALDAFEPMPYATFNSMLDDPPGFRNYWTAEQLPDLTPETIALLHERARDLPAGPSMMFMPAWGGAIRDAAPEDSPLASRGAQFVMHPLLLWSDPADDARNIAHGRAYREDLRDHAMDSAYLNFIGDEGQERRVAAFGAANHERLARVKAKWDPADVFRGNHVIRPASAEASVGG